MDRHVIYAQALERIKKIHQLSTRVNGGSGARHQQRLLELMRDHVAEIQDLVTAQNDHYLVETGDLLILCFELLLEGQADIDAVIEKCFGRYERKLSQLMTDMISEK